MIRTSLVALLVLTCVVSSAQVNLLNPTPNEYYVEKMEVYDGYILSEDRLIKADDLFKLTQQTWYDVPAIDDEETRYVFTIGFSDTTAAILKKVINLQTDTAMVECFYHTSPLLCTYNSVGITGTIEIVKWSKDLIVLKEDIQVSGCYNTVKYIGERTFKRGK